MIGVFDSGIGGLTVLRALRALLPQYSFLYFGDTARTPYGNKSPEVIAAYGREDAKLLLDHGAKIIVIACNTVSSVASEKLRAELGVPVFDVVAPAVRGALDRTKGSVGIIGTRATINSGVYQKLLSADKNVSVHAEACPLFVPLVEEGWEGTNEAQYIVKKALWPLKLKGIDTLILGCTHYPFLTEPISLALGQDVELVDSSYALAEEVAVYLRDHKDLEATLDKSGKLKIMTSDVTAHLTKLAKSWLGETNIEKVSL